VKLSDIQSAKRLTPPKVLIYGGPKVGKSTFAAGAPSPVAIQLEEGLSSIDIPAFPLASSWAEVLSCVEALAEPHEFRTVVVDSLDWLEPLIWAEVCRVGKVDSIEQVGGGYGKGYVETVKLWREFLDGMDWLRSRGMTPILIAHDEVRKIEPVDGEPYEQAGIKLHKRAAGLVTEWADVIGYARSKHSLVGDPKKHTRAVSTGQRVLCVGQRPAYVSGNRFGLPDEMPLVWADFQAALDAARS